MGSLNKKFVKINKAAENMTKVTSEKKKKKLALLILPLIKWVKNLT